MNPANVGTELVPRLRSAVVLHVEEDSCEVWLDGVQLQARYAPQFPGPRVERVSPGHLVALAAAPGGASVVLWRWYDAVVLGPGSSGAVRLWEPAHGEVVAQPRPSYEPQNPGSRVYASAGLPGAEWWVAGAVGPPETAVVELDVVAALYTDNDLWNAALAGPA
ncbi:MAG TPA: hypothetical protein VHX15_18160 [Frankiaceae bacterium]|jgi:hypothetical protein|nr:hypothetical protein [Frankiaceae bacterium]